MFFIRPSKSLQGPYGPVKVLMVFIGPFKVFYGPLKVLTSMIQTAVLKAHVKNTFAYMFNQFW